MLHLEPKPHTARLAQSAERKTLNLVVVGSGPTVGVLTMAGVASSDDAEV